MEPATPIGWAPSSPPLATDSASIPRSPAKIDFSVAHAQMSHGYGACADHTSAYTVLSSDAALWQRQLQQLVVEEQVDQLAHLL